MDLLVTLLATYSLSQKNLDQNIEYNFKNPKEILEISNPFELLNSLSYGSNPLDKKLLWIVFNLLSKDLSKFRIPKEKDKKFNNPLNFKKVYEEFLIRCARNFANQLEILGLWEYAIYVVLFIKNGIFI